MSDDECEELTELFSEDTDVFGSRPPNTIISKPSDLTHDEKLLLKDLFVAYVDMPGQGSHASLSPEFYKEFFDEIFKYWVSSHRVNIRPVLQPKTEEQTRIQIDDSWAESEPQATTGPKIVRKRKLFEAIFLTMQFNSVEETFTWTWQNNERKDAPFSAIKRYLPRGVTKNDVILMAIENYDSFERKRITSYNRDLIINAARRRIHKWARAGSSHDDTIDSADEIGERSILSLVLASDVYLKTTRDALEIAAEIEKRRSMICPSFLAATAEDHDKSRISLYEASTSLTNAK
ncbi:uncharacterized protein NECHADRAFT_77433 [Fusarium vanettenii 77-13-4]|uniref:Uncharacterized protein n=1 Tax=Fusarium vanettenii (strain ATCC MYA-4622 / CBS 123669 / FGSC 9596 / NRRL 45880 / 77-13-4) TaxID=660122 RepID=C7YL77_FUSV7|nr:uncharacterized protein NECHADRAFT_77433 [Fusarium vanettenii 77-13-4]EEU46739.1 hypothetical protein NECHADRAFT_77433 [Fusarium vanettenii 77-13-4]